VRGLCTVFIVVALALPVLAEDGQGWTFSGRFQGSSNSSGLVMKADPTLGYSFSRTFQTYVGLPVYFVKDSSTTSPTSTTPTSNGFMNGLGNAYLGFHIGVNRDAVDFASNMEATAPTGDKDKGFSTGRVTVDWSNSFSHRSVTPFASIGWANTVSDTSFFVRPFTSLGFVGHFDAGAKINLSRYVDVVASVYAVRGAGQQTIISKIVGHQQTTLTTPVADAISSTGTTASGAAGASGTGPSGTSPSGTGANATGANASGQKGSSTAVFETASQTVGTSALANDHGFSSWFGINAGSNVDFHGGYTRSVGYDLNTVFASIAFRFGR
jgi:hypothetical protein